MPPSWKSRSARSTPDVILVNLAARDARSFATSPPRRTATGKDIAIVGVRTQRQRRHHRRRVPRRRARTRAAPSRRARAGGGQARVRRTEHAPQRAPSGNLAARNRTPLRCAARFLARPDRLRARRHARAREQGVSGNVRLRGIRGHPGHVDPRHDRARRRRRFQDAAQETVERRKAAAEAQPESAARRRHHVRRDDGIRRSELRRRAVPADQLPPADGRAWSWPRNSTCCVRRIWSPISTTASTAWRNSIAPSAKRPRAATIRRCC